MADQANPSPLQDSGSLAFTGAGVFNTGPRKNAPGIPGTQRVSYFDGQLADIAIYNQALTQNQLADRNQPTAVTGQIRSVLSPALCIDDANSSSTDSNPIDLNTCAPNAENQQWTLQPNGTITIYGKCLDIFGNKTANNSKLDLYHCVTNAPNQQWKLHSDGSIYNPQSGRCIDDPANSTTPGTPLDIYDCLGSNNESWTTP